MCCGRLQDRLDLCYVRPDCAQPENQLDCGKNRLDLCHVRSDYAQNRLGQKTDSMQKIDSI